jgi:hypothetical protein
LKNGCDGSAKDANGMTALMYAIQQVGVLSSHLMGFICVPLQCNQRLIQFLVDHGSTVSDAVDAENKNVLHLLADQCMNDDLSSILKLVSVRFLCPKRFSGCSCVCVAEISRS